MVAEAAIDVPPGYAYADDDLFTDDAGMAIGLWLPDELVAGTARRVLVDDLGDRILVVSVIPAMVVRGDPNLVPVLADFTSWGKEVSEGVHRTETDAGLVVHLWSDGDGFLVVAGEVEAAGRAYLVAREAERQPLDTWPAGTCLYFHDDELLPWAPFPTDPVVPCDGPHNAEVIASTPAVEGFDAYDDDFVTFERNYVCDRAYEAEIGAQRDHRPGLITYMPDSDEFARGDRYLACVIQVETADGTGLVVGPISDLPDLAWSPAIGDCFDYDLRDDPVDCDDAHTFEFVGEVVYTGATWPTDLSLLAEACEPTLSELTDGPVAIDVFGSDLNAYAFEQGERRVRCLAFASGVDGTERVIGSFTGEWRVLADGVAA